MKPVKKIVYGPSDAEGKKYKAVLYDGKNNKLKTINFGEAGADDYTRHDADVRDKRKKSYIARHNPTENWSRSGIDTAGFHAKHLLWNETTLSASARDIEKRFKVDVVLRI